MPKKIKTKLNKASKKLNFLDSPGLEAEAVLSLALQKPQAWLIANADVELSSDQAELFDHLVDQRIRGVPLAYLSGQKEFYGLDFKITPDTLVPRPETELLIDELLKAEPSSADAVLDIGTGSGAIIISLAKHLKTKPLLLASDISSPALAVAKKNAKRHQADIIFKKGSLLEPWLDYKPLKQADRIFIAANLPYLPADYLKNLNRPEQKGLTYEPKNALISGHDGLDHYRRLAEQIRRLSAVTAKPSILLFAEHNPEQTEKMSEIFSSADSLQTKSDLTGSDRLMVACF